MPLVLVHYNPVQVSEKEIEELARQVLPGAVAEALHVEEIEDAHLTPADLEVWVTMTSFRDVQAHDVGVVVFANVYEPRRARQKQATEEITAAVEKAVPGRKGYVWVLLAPGEFFEFGKEKIAEPPPRNIVGV